MRFWDEAEGGSLRERTRERSSRSEEVEVRRCESERRAGLDMFKYKYSLDVDGFEGCE